MARLTVVDIQHKSFKKKLQGYDPVDVDQYLDEIIETLEDEAHARAALAGEVADLKERISHFKAMEESLQSTLLLAQRTADEVKASAHKEADLIKQEARLAAEREIAALGDRIEESRREAQRAQDTAEQAKSELRSLLMSHLSLIDRVPLGVPHAAATTAPALVSASALALEPAPAPAIEPAGRVAPATAPPVSAPARSERPVIVSETDEFERLPLNGGGERRLVE